MDEIVSARPQNLAENPMLVFVEDVHAVPSIAQARRVFPYDGLDAAIPFRRNGQVAQRNHQNPHGWNDTATVARDRIEYHEHVNPTQAETFLTFPIRSDKLTMTVRVTESLCHRKTEFQTIDILQTDAFGRILLLDQHIQLAELDEHAYHEALVHIPLMSVQQPKRALVVGGGDGGVLRELVKYRSMQRIDMVDIDGGVVEESKRHLPFVSDGAFDDPRVCLTIGDAFPFVKENREPYDLIVVDATDTYEEEDGEISAALFTDEFYADCRRLLAPGGFVVTQADNLLFCPYSLDEISANFKRTFAHVGSYWAMVPSFGGFSGYCWAGDKPLVPRWQKPEFATRYLSELTYQMAFQPLPF